MKSLKLNRQIFRSIQWKLVLLYLLLVIFIMSIISVFLLNQIESLYYDNFFKTDVQDGFIATRFSEVEIDVSDFDELKSRVESYRDILSVNRVGRSIYILDNLGRVLYSSEQDFKKDRFETPNVRQALANNTGNTIYENQDFLDYAQLVITKNGKGKKYVIYVIDNKEELRELLSKVRGTIIISIIVALFLAAIIGFLFARTITTPIKNLAGKARKIAQGDFEQKIKAKSNDEIGQLTSDFNHMASELSTTLNQISNEKSKVETILTHMTDGVMAFDKSGNLIHINPAAQEIFKDDISDKKFGEIFSKIGVNIKIEDFIYLKEDYVQEKAIKFEEIYVKLYFVSFINEKGEVGGVISVLQDITEQQKLDNMRKEFVANVSHELRTPLTTIKSYIETLQDGAIEDRETSTEFLDVISTEADRMTRLVKDLLQLSRLEYQQVNLNKSEVCLDNLIKKVIKKLYINIRNKGQEIEYYVTTEVPEFITIDQDKIEQVLLNIIGNANKYTHTDGKISIYYGAMFDKVYIKVIDNGIGIPENDQKRVFERFYRVDKARSRQSGGTGLGLAIAKEIIESHGGSISISSKIGKGTEVVINLPKK